jgi:hypothetical protein
MLCGMKQPILALALSIAITACAGLPFPAQTPTPSPLPLATFTPTPVVPTVDITDLASTPASGGQKSVFVLAYPNGDKAVAGGSLSFNLSFEPVIFQSLNGGTSQTLWENSDVVEAQFCFAPDAPCELADQWVPFASDQQFTVPVVWLGPRTYWFKAQFRDSAGDIVPALSGDSSAPQETAETSIEVVSVIEAGTPVHALPEQVQTAIAVTQAAFPVSGSMKIEGSPCCVGGKAGSTLPVKVNFAATSPAGAVTDMKVSSCFVLTQTPDQVSWEPFAPEKTFDVNVALNWTTFSLGAQYRDAQGNLSPVYCDEIAVEGSP